MLKRGVGFMGLKTIEGGITTVKLPSDVRLVLREKNWTILDAVKNGLRFRSENSMDIYEHPAYLRLLDRLTEIKIKLNELEGVKL